MSDVKLIFEQGRSGRIAFDLPVDDMPEIKLGDIIPKQFLSDTPAELPELSQVEVVRHYTRLSQRNIGVDNAFYPLGSCTMKFNPRINEHLAGKAEFRDVHPYEIEDQWQGLLQVIAELEQLLQKLTGLAGVTLQPAAGAHGELTGLLIASAYFKDKGEQRTKILIPDTAHGTNPASAARAGFQIVKIPSNTQGRVDLESLEKAVDAETACLMLTNPNTLGLFEPEVLKIAEILHSRGALLYLDGANFNAFVGSIRPADFGVDIMHLNLHKTFSTPHGGGGPGSGPVAVTQQLAEFLPVPRTKKSATGKYTLDFAHPKSIGQVRSFLGNIPPIIKAYCYILSLGAKGLKRASQLAVLNANYLMELIKDKFEVAYPGRCMHEFVVSTKRYKELGVRALDIAKKILDYGVHPPTVYFPLIVEEALMIEPTETETKETLDEFAGILREIATLAENDPEAVKRAPTRTPVQRVDEFRAARYPILRWQAK